MNGEQRALLEEWRSDATTLLYANFAMAESCRRRNRLLGATSAVLSASVGTLVFAWIGKPPQVWPQILAGVASMIAAVLAALHSFLNLAEVESRYRRSGSGYAAIRKEIEQLLAMPPETEADLKLAVDVIRTSWERLREEAVPMSSRTLRKYKPTDNPN